MNRQTTLLRRIHFVTSLFIIGLVISGLTALPLQTEVDILARSLHAGDPSNSRSREEVARWLSHVQDALHHTKADYPFLFYGTDWLAFGHFAIALAFIGALIDPVRNRWLFTFGMIVCVLVIPYALVCGAFRAIPLWWRFIDSSFGVLGFIPVSLCNKWAKEIEKN